MRGDGRRRSSWTYRGVPVPFVPYPRHVFPSLSLRGLSFAPIYRRALGDAEVVTLAAIPIERTNAPVFVISGGRDRMWPSSHMADSLLDRHAVAHGDHQIVHLHYPRAGHSLAPWCPELRSTSLARGIEAMRMMGFGGPFNLGGSPRSNRTAAADAWQQVLAFFGNHLSDPLEAFLSPRDPHDPTTSP